MSKQVWREISARQTYSMEEYLVEERKYEKDVVRAVMNANQSTMNLQFRNSVPGSHPSHLENAPLAIPQMNMPIPTAIPPAPMGSPPVPIRLAAAEMGSPNTQNAPLAIPQINMPIPTAIPPAPMGSPPVPIRMAAAEMGSTNTHRSETVDKKEAVMGMMQMVGEGSALL